MCGMRHMKKITSPRVIPTIFPETFKKDCCEISFENQVKSKSLFENQVTLKGLFENQVGLKRL